jgi:hypothetical protein
VASLARLLETPALRGVARRIAGAMIDVTVRRSTLVEDLELLVRVPPESLVVLTSTASRDASGYRLDMALKVARSRGAAAFMLTDGRTEVAASASTIAERAGMAILASDSGADLAGIITAVEREIRGSADAALARIDEAVRALRTAEEDGVRPEDLVAIAADCLECELRLGEPNGEELSAPVIVDDEVESSLCVTAPDGHHRVAAAAVASLAAGALGRARAAARRAKDAPIRSRGQLLAEFLLASPDRGDRLLERMRAGGLAIDGWHAAVRMEFDNLEHTADDDELASYRVTERIGRIALEHARTSVGIWHMAQVGGALVLVRTSRSDPGTRGGRDMTDAADHMIASIRARIPSALVVCGVGSLQVGSMGLRTSAAEARAALAAARASQRCNQAVPYDKVGLERTLIEWYASDTAREAVDSLLAPLDKLAPAKRDASIRTLRSYLDHQGSLSGAAEELHLHRNAVAYRIDRIFETIGVDRSDPDSRLLLQLACRTRSLG